mmetsp:Transcript_33990/g.86197  ORF Transcript_33990/g.86197 Transcript_33990/m.86197 type:complete len:277 (-) Transcript_33990:835-1665(-)
MLAVVVAQRCAEALAAGHWAAVRGLEVRRRLQTVPEEHVQDLVVRAVVQLPHRRLLLVFVAQVGAILLVQLGQHVVLDGVDGDDARPRAVVEGCALQELVLDLRAFSPFQVHLDQPEPRLLCGPLLVAAPARMRVAQVAAPAIARDPSRALLLGRAVRVVHADPALPASLHKGQGVQLVHQIPGHGCGELDVRLLVLAACNVHPKAARDARRMPREKGADVRLQLVVRNIGMQVAHPQRVGALHAHHARAVRGYVHHLPLPFGAPPRQAQGPRELR